MSTAAGRAVSTRMVGLRKRARQLWWQGRAIPKVAADLNMPIWWVEETLFTRVSA